MIIYNSSEKDTRTLKTERFNERMAGFSKAMDIITGQMVDDIKSIKIAPKATMVFELRK